jgi:serine phosphatase RsbU (regulator of sigma subunit)
VTNDNGSQGRMLLLIEDDRADAMLVQALLEEQNDDRRLVWATSLEDAARHLASRPECVLLDLGLPDASGVEALEAVISAAPDAAVVVLTGVDDERRGLEAIARGAQDYLVKGNPDPELLARSIRYATERKRAANTSRQLREAELRTKENLRLESGLLPRPLLRTDTVRCMTLYRPGGEQALLGGDFFDVVELEDGTIRAMIGDVAGHGPDEAALGVRLRVAWRTLVLAGVSPAESFATLQDLLVSERPSAELFVTVCEASVSPDRSLVDLCLAGHPAPVIVSDGEVVAQAPASGPPLGVLEDARWSSTEVPLGSSWAMLLYTDGLVENVDTTVSGRERLGTEGLVDVVSNCVKRGDGIQRIVQETLVALQDTGPGVLTDDVAIVAIAPLDVRQ